MNDATNIISVFGWKIPVALFVAIVGLVGTLRGAIMAAVKRIRPRDNA
jgi:CheY-specific phosphatase CheX